MITSREEILEKSREILKSEGWKGLNIRAVAASCGISIGTIYNYYKDKGELERATVESIWYDIFHTANTSECGSTLSDYVRWLYTRMEYGSCKYPGFFSLHSVSLINFDIKKGKETMMKSWLHMQISLSEIISSDKLIKSDAFSETFTKEIVSHMILSLLISAMLEEKYDPTPALEILNRLLYS